ncbi:MAG: hypothetical protein E4G96_03055, partial [Chrysiogenales bacterium]
MKTTLRLALLALAVLLYSGPAPAVQREPAVTGETPATASSTAAVKPRTQAKKPAPAKATNFTVLFFNDLHGNLMPFKVTKEDGSSVEVGGIAQIATLVNTIRAENRKKGIKTFLLVAGDILQGTPISTVFQGKPDIDILNMMGVDVMTVGNHEFDFGLENYLELRKAAKFPFISSNIIWKESRELMNPPAAFFPLW